MVNLELKEYIDVKTGKSEIFIFGGEESINDKIKLDNMRKVFFLMKDLSVDEKRRFDDLFVVSYYIQLFKDGYSFEAIDYLFRIKFDRCSTVRKDTLENIFRQRQLLRMASEEYQNDQAVVGLREAYDMIQMNSYINNHSEDKHRFCSLVKTNSIRH